MELPRAEDAFRSHNALDALDFKQRHHLRTGGYGAAGAVNLSSGFVGLTLRAVTVLALPAPIWPESLLQFHHNKQATELPTYALRAP